MGARKQSQPEATYLAAENATELWGLVMMQTRFTRDLANGRPVGAGDGFHHRLLYLMAAALYRSVQHLVPNPDWLRLLDTIEAYADKKATIKQLSRARDRAACDDSAWPAASAAAAHSTHLLLDDYKVMEGVDYISDAAGYAGAAKAGALNANASFDEGSAVWKTRAFQRAKKAHERAMCERIRDIFGNPYRPVETNPAWLTSTVVALARGIYDEKAFDRLPILADALQDAGCESADVLDHCRDAKQVHVRGCWVVDLILGKEEPRPGGRSGRSTRKPRKKPG
jgi:hypothetical protein